MHEVEVFHGSNIFFGVGRRFGDIIEAIHMGGSGGNEQTLYATMKLNSPAMIPGILTEGVYRTKYTINVMENMSGLENSFPVTNPTTIIFFPIHMETFSSYICYSCFFFFYLKEL